MKTALLRPVLLLMLAAAITGCSRYYWSKSGATAEQFAQDNQSCLQQAAGTLPSGASSEAVEQYYRACLASLHWPEQPAPQRGVPAGPPLSRPI